MLSKKFWFLYQEEKALWKQKTWREKIFVKWTQVKWLTNKYLNIECSCSYFKVVKSAARHTQTTLDKLLALNFSPVIFTLFLPNQKQTAKPKHLKLYIHKSNHNRHHIPSPNPALITVNTKQLYNRKQFYSCNQSNCPFTAVEHVSHMINSKILLLTYHWPSRQFLMR